MIELNEHYINIFDDRKRKEEYFDAVKSILEKSYSDIGGPLNLENYEQLLDDRYFWKLVKKEGRIVCCAIYRTNGSLDYRKLSLVGTDESELGKNCLKDLLEEDSTEIDRHMFGEFSGAVEHILTKYFNMPVIPAKTAERILRKLGKTIVRIEDDGNHYIRNIKGSEQRKIMLGYPPKSLTESILLEKTRQELINKSKAGDNYKGDQSKGKNRWERRTKSRIDTHVQQYNRINMNELFKNDTLDITINVHGETDDYEVRIKFSGVVNEIQREIKANNNKLEFKCVFKALARLYNTEDVSYHCNCLHPDTTVRLLDGTNPPIKDIKLRFDNGEELFVYSTDEKGDFKVGEVRSVWINGESDTFLKITLDNGETSVVTPEHLFMLRDGSYAPANKLEVGQSLMPMYRREDKGYESLKLNHKIISIETIKLEESIPVYDIEVEKWNNFTLGSGVVVHNCKDFQFRQSFWSTKGGYNAGPQQTSNGKWIANPNDSKGGGCKHVNLVQSNADWIMKISSVINNYIHYMEQNMQRQYADLMFPKLFGMPYERAVQLNLFDTGDELDTDASTVDTSNQIGRTRGRFRKDYPVNNQKNFGGSQMLRRDLGKQPGQQRLNLIEPGDDTMPENGIGQNPGDDSGQ